MIPRLSGRSSALASMMRAMVRRLLFVFTGFVMVATPVAAEVKVTRVTCLGTPGCIRLANDTVEVVITTAIGPRVIRYAFLGGDNLLGEVPDLVTKTAFGEWKPWGGHRLWTAPEEMPRSYVPDNSPIEAVVDGGTVRLAQPVEAQTGILKEMTVTLASTGTAVTIGHRLTNKGQWAIELAPWALTILNPGGAVILPQEPYRSHDEALQPVRQATLWAYTDLSDPRWQIGPKFLRLKPDPSRTTSQKIGIANHQNWAGYLRRGTLFIKRYDWQDGKPYPDGGVNTETYTAGSFVELETLGALANLLPGASATHEERWFLFKDVKDAAADADLEQSLAPHLAVAR
jgi:hypothetical protein